ncbi:hypothetical protein [Klebsiella pneumoniae]|uniref:hypothetical protein n=1 Tax=Klebsiella pneumoniae TaxID=573 RepID=UPI0038476FC3
MTKSTITRERLEWLSQISCRDDIEDIGGDEIRELASMALAAMDGEPVAWTWHYREQWHVTNDERRAEFVAKDGDVAVLPLYRHAQPVPVVPEEKPIPNTLSMYAVDAVAAIAEVKGWNACLAAMLQAEPVTTDNKLADDFDFDRFNDVTWLECVASNPHMHSPTTSAIARVALELNKRIGAGNSPAQSDCCPAQNVVSPAQSPIVHGYRPECECSGCKATARICTEMAVNSPANPGCWCRTCRPVDLNDMRFMVCPDCGNKRCPRANDHRNACTGSNEPGQEGSAYPDTPREVK